MQIIFYSLLLLGFIGGNVLRIEFGNGYAVMLLDTCVFFTSIYILTTQYKRILSHSLFRPLVILLGLFCVSLIPQLFHYTTFQLLQGLSYILRFGIYSTLLFLSTSKKTQSTLFLTLLGLMTIVFGYLQYFLYPMLRNLYYLGWDEHLYRLFGTILDPNFMGIFLVLFLLYSLNLALSYKKSLWKIFFFTISTIDLIALFLTFSRESYLLAILGVSIYTFLVKKISLNLLFLGIGVVILISALFSFYGQKSEGTKLFRTTSLYQRFESDIHAVDIFLHHPILGVGFNTYRYAQKEAGFTNTDNWLISHAGAGPENSYLLVLATTGIIGFGVYLYFWKKIISFANKNKQKALLVSSIVVFLLSGLFINSLFYPFLLVWIFLLLSTSEI